MYNEENHTGLTTVIHICTDCFAAVKCQINFSSASCSLQFLTLPAPAAPPEGSRLQKERQPCMCIKVKVKCRFQTLMTNHCLEPYKHNRATTMERQLCAQTQSQYFINNLLTPRREQIRVGVIYESLCAALSTDERWWRRRVISHICERDRSWLRWVLLAAIVSLTDCLSANFTTNLFGISDQVQNIFTRNQSVSERFCVNLL